MIKSKNQAGYTLAEILITLVILSVLAGLAIPSYTNTVRQSRLGEARSTVNIIFQAEKIYRINQGQFWGPGATTAAAINTNLSTDISPVNFTTLSVSGPVATEFTARATAANGDYYQLRYVQATATSTCQQSLIGTVTNPAC